MTIASWVEPKQITYGECLPRTAVATPHSMMWIASLT